MWCLHYTIGSVVCNHIIAYNPQNFILHGLAAAFIEHDSDLVGGAANAADDKLFSFVLLHRHPPCVDEQKEVLYYLFVKQYSTARLAAIRGQSDRNIRKLRMTIQKKLQKRMYEHLSEKLENDHGLTLREREFVEEYEALLQTMGKDAVIRRENKTKPRKKKAALDDDKDG